MSQVRTHSKLCLAMALVSASFVVAAEGLVTRGDVEVGKIYGRSSTGTFASHSNLPMASRNQDAANADLVRDWNAKPSSDAGATVKQRSDNAMHKDLMRDWSADRPADKGKTAYSNQ